MMWRRGLCCVLLALIANLAPAQTVSLESVFTGVPFVPKALVTHQPEGIISRDKLQRLGSGTVVVAVLVGEDGAPLRHRILSAEPPLLFDRYVNDALPDFRFAIGSRNGVAMVYETHLTMHFAPPQ